MPTTFKIGGFYNWKGQPERLIYLGDNISGNSYWHQFAKVDKPNVVWCEVKSYDLDCFEETITERLHYQKALGQYVPNKVKLDTPLQREIADWNAAVDLRKAEKALRRNLKQKDFWK